MTVGELLANFWTREIRPIDGGVMVDDVVLEFSRDDGKSWQTNRSYVVKRASKDAVDLVGNENWWVKDQGNAKQVILRVCRRADGDVIELDEHDLRVGDQINEWLFTRKNGPWYSYATQIGGTAVVTNVTQARVQVNGRDFHTFSATDPIRWRVWRKRTSSTVQVNGKKKVIDEFPGKCTFCGNRAYVGLFEIIHQDVGVFCTARTK